MEPPADLLPKIEHLASEKDKEKEKDKSLSPSSVGIVGPRFLITCDANPALRVVASTPGGALLALRQAVVQAVGTPAAAHLLSREEQAALGLDASLTSAATADEALVVVRNPRARLADPSAAGVGSLTAARLRWNGTATDKPFLELGGKRSKSASSSSSAASGTSTAADVYNRAFEERCDAWGLQGAVWMGFGLPSVQRALEGLSQAALAMITPARTAAWWPRYRFRHSPAPALAALAEARSRRETAEARQVQSIGDMYVALRNNYFVYFSAP
jgi:hypothetical protein